MALLLAAMTAAVLHDQTLASLHDPRSGEALDRGLVLRFPGPASFTGAANLADPVLLHILQRCLLATVTACH